MTPYKNPAFKSLHLDLLINGRSIYTASGFVVNHGRPFLITNHHVMTGTNPFTKRNMGMPDSIRISHHKAAEVGVRLEKTEALYDSEGNPRWHEHPTMRGNAEIVALPLTDLAGVDLFPYDVFNPIFKELPNEGFTKIVLEPTDSVSIIGFPFGKSSGGGFPIWVNGFLATAVDDTYLDRPVILVDSRTREGQSGSPVVLFRPAGAPIRGENGTLSVGSGAFGVLLGIYSGRIDQESDIGMIWKLSALVELLTSLGMESGTVIKE